MEVKQSAPHPPSGKVHRGKATSDNKRLHHISQFTTDYYRLGYSASGVEKATQHVYDPEKLAEIRNTTPDVKESFECGRADDPVMPNIWLPEGVFPGFSETCLDFYWVGKAIHRRLSYLQLINLTP